MLGADVTFYQVVVERENTRFPSSGCDLSQWEKFLWQDIYLPLLVKGSHINLVNKVFFPFGSVSCLNTLGQGDASVSIAPVLFCKIFGRAHYS